VRLPLEFLDVSGADDLAGGEAALYLFADLRGAPENKRGGPIEPPSCSFADVLIDRGGGGRLRP
jgi:hypothetical protein